MSSAHLRARILAVSVTLLSTNSLVLPSLAASSKKEKAAPTTLLIPLTPRMDDGSNSSPNLAPVIKGAPRSTSSSALTVNSTATTPSTPTQAPSRKATKNNAPVRGRQTAVKTAPPAAPVPSFDATGGISGTNTGDLTGTDPGLAPIEDSASTVGKSSQAVAGDAIDPLIDENSLLKGTVQIVADDTEYDQEKNTFLGTGNAVAIIAGQNSKLEADTILYDQNSQTIDARGNVKIIRDGQLTTGSSFKFKIDSDEYLITNPDTELEGTQIIARSARGTGDGLAFKNGTFSLPQPLHIANNAGNGPASMAERSYEVKAHPDAYLPVKPSFTFTARKMVYEKYKESGNLTVFGGKMKFDHFTIPMPKFTATASQATRVVFPVTPVVGSNYNVGGINIGPSFNYAVGKTGAFSWAPLLQVGGRTLDGSTSTTSGKLGAGARIGYQSDRLSTHLAYGSVTNLVVGDFKYRFNDKTLFQSGINRFLNDGMFGMRRAHYILEGVDYRNVTTVPYISLLQFRSSGGWAQDQPTLVDLQSNAYSNLFNQTGKTVNTSAFRLQEQITVVTHPIFSVGNEKYGAKMNIYTGAALRAYSTGDGMAMGQFGPILTVKANKARFQIGYTQSGVSGQSPFVFDQFIQGSSSTSFAGDVKLSKWLTIGTSLGYNLTSAALYSRAITAAIGPDDFKLMVTRDTISGINRFGFDVLYGQPVRFNKLIMKGVPDHGQLSGGI